MSVKTDLKSMLHDNGYVIMRQWFQVEQVRQLKAHARDLFNQCDHGVDVYMLENCPDWLLSACIEDRLAAALVAMGITDPEFLSVKTVIKDGKRDFASPWHQDRPYWGGIEKYSLWIALDDCTVENGCLKIIKGSQHRGVLDHHDLQYDNFTLRVDEQFIQNERVENVLLRAGDAFLFHDCLLHASHPNVNGCERWSFIATYRSRSIQDTSLRWSSSLSMT